MGDDEVTAVNSSRMLQPIAANATRMEQSKPLYVHGGNDEYTMQFRQCQGPWLLRGDDVVAHCGFVGAECNALQDNVLPFAQHAFVCVDYLTFAYRGTRNEYGWSTTQEPVLFASFEGTLVAVARPRTDVSLKCATRCAMIQSRRRGMNQERVRQLLPD